MIPSQKWPLQIVVGAKDNASKALQRISVSFTGMGRMLGRVRDFTLGLGRTFIDAGRKAAVFGSVAGAALGALVQRVTGAGDKTIKLARHLNVNAEKLQAWRYAAKDAGVEASAFEGAMTKLSTSIGDAGLGRGRAKDFIAALRMIGVEFEDAEGKAKSMTTIFPEIADALQRLPDVETRASFSKALFGESNFMLLDALKDGAAGLEAAEASARAAGAILTQDQLLGFEAFQQSLHEIGVEFTGISNQLVSSLLPTIQKVADAFKGWLVDNQERFKEWAEWIRVKLPAALTELKKAGAELWSDWQPHFQEMWDGMKEFWSWLGEAVVLTVGGLKEVVDIFDRINQKLGIGGDGKPRTRQELDRVYEQRESERALQDMGRGRAPMTDEEVLNLFRRDFMRPAAPASGEVKVSFANMPRGARVSRDEAARRSMSLDVGYAMREVGLK